MPTASDPNSLTEVLPTGYDGQNVPDDFSIPSCGIEDVDRALFNLFDQKVKFNVVNKGETVKVPVVFATGERFAVVKRKKAIRDRRGTFILPMISVRRSSIDQAMNMGGIGRGIGQDTGDLVIKRRLSKSDRDYQRVVNRLNLKNQDDVASQANELTTSEPVGSQPGTVATRRTTGAREDLVQSGEVLRNDLDDNIFEIITIPFPNFFVVHYEITFWTQYTVHMNQMIETMMSSYDAQGNQFRIDTDKGYWFVAFIDNELTSKDNFEDFVDDERVIKYTFSIMTTGYLVAPDHAGRRNAFRKYISAPQVSFDVSEVALASGQVLTRRPYGAGTGDIDKFVLSDVVQLDKGGEPQVGRNFGNVEALKVTLNPFTGKEERTYARVRTRNQRQGETVGSGIVTVTLDEIS